MHKMDKTKDPRWLPYLRDDDYNKATLVHPDPNSDIGWLCPGCKTNTTIFYGQGPQYMKLHRQRQHGKYISRTDTRLCLDCWSKKKGES